MSDQVRNFMGYMWVQREGDVYTIGINEEGLEEIQEINSIELPAENEEVDADTAVGSIETDDGPLDIYTPVSGNVVEINTAVLEDPSLLQEDPYDSWLLKIESDDDLDDSEDDEDEADDDDLDDDDEEEDDDFEEDDDK